MRQRQKRAAARHGAEAEAIVREIRSIQSTSGHNLARLWDDWIASMALALANGCDRRPEVWEPREAEYMRIVERHGPKVMESFAAMFGMLVQGLDRDLPTDLLGSIYMALEMGNDGAGQFFTPSSVCELMVRMTMQPDIIRAEVEKNGWITLQEPAIGGGAMVIPAVAVLREAGLNPSEHLHVTGVDIDISVLRMAYAQLSLLGVPATLIHGNTLTLEVHGAYYTPLHVWGGWSSRLRRGPQAIAEAVANARSAVDQLVEQAQEPEPPATAPTQGQLFGDW